MLFVLSPAKSINEAPLPQQLAGTLAHSTPAFTSEAAELIAILQEQSPQQLADLMHISDKLAQLNVTRYALWSKTHSADNAKQALLAFDGDVYDGMQAASMSVEQLNWAQQHLCILSGLYGVLRPLDWLQPYRLEMGTALRNARGSNLYQFWGDTIAQYLNARFQEQGSANNAEPVLVNLASQEYFKSINRKVLQARVAECVFEDCKDGKYKIISFYAKRARGMMMRYAIEHQAQTPEDLMHFDSAGYVYAPEASSADKLVFRREEIQKR